MERMISTSMHLGFICSFPGLSVLAAGRRWGRVSLTGIEDGGMQTRLLLHRLLHRQEKRMLQNKRVSFYSKQLNFENISRGAGKTMRAHEYSQQGNFLEHSTEKDRDSAPRYTDLVQKQREETMFQQASQPMMAYPGTQETDLEVIEPELLQGTKEWLNLRKNRITASAFGNSLGFWGIRRMELWEEKIGIKEPFSGNSATRWGSNQEAAAIEKYKEITSNSVDHMAFKIYHPEDEYLSWLGASPDGLITYKLDGEHANAAEEKLGILEVKCPHNKGKPELGSPWETVPYYYMPQAQGLLEIFDRKYMDFYVWTANGSSVFRIERDPDYWGLMFRIMAEFWWGHVIPAKCALTKGKSIADIQAFRPVEDHPETEKIVSMSRHLARNSRLIWRERMGHIQRV